MADTQPGPAAALGALVKPPEVPVEPKAVVKAKPEKAAETRPEDDSSTSVVQSNESLYARIKSDFKAVRNRDAKVSDMISGLDARIKGSTSDPVFNLVSPKKAKELKAEFIEEKVVIQEK